jgi:predicted AlkP superfamily phosphohydrolase/phosphomutase
VLALIGLDSVSRPLLDELIDQGRMPSLASLRQRGPTVPLQTPGSSFPAGAFPSLWTGHEVEDHGLYYPFLWSPDKQRVVVGTNVPSPPAIWEQISAAGGQVLVIDPYEARRPTHPVSMCLSGVQFHNRVVLERWDSPPGSLRRWERRIGRGGPAQEVFGRQSVRRLTLLRNTLVRASSRAADLVEAAMPEERPDLLVAMLPAVHLGGHQLWDPAAVLPRGNPFPEELSSGLRDVYASADVALGRMLASLPDDADVILFSTLGMAANMSRNDLLPGMLSAVLDGRSGQAAATGSAWRFRASVPTPLRAAIADGIPDRLALALAARAEFRGVDWGSTRAFCVPSDAHGLIRINQRDREAKGVVSSEDVDGLLDEIVAGLTSFVESDGASVIRAIDRTRHVVPAGRALDLLPDLIVHWSQRPASSTEVVTSPRFGRVHRLGVGTGRSGNHTDDAWALVVPGRSQLRHPGRAYRVTDLSQTALALCGVPAGGEPLLEPPGA